MLSQFANKFLAVMLVSVQMMFYSQPGYRVAWMFTTSPFKCLDPDGLSARHEVRSRMVGAVYFQC